MASFTKNDLDVLRLDLSIKAKNGINFLVAAALVWFAIAYVWTLSYGISQKALLTFYVGGVMLPLAWLLGKVFRTAWTIPDNPLQPLGLWLNFAQLVYFPILIFVYVRHPEHFIMVYVIITGAHFFPYAWFYNTPAYAVMSVLISVGAMWLRFALPLEMLYLIPLSTGVALLVLAVWVGVDYQLKSKSPNAYQTA